MVKGYLMEIYLCNGLGILLFLGLGIIGFGLGFMGFFVSYLRCYVFYFNILC